MKRTYWLIALFVSCSMALTAQTRDALTDGVASVVVLAGETETVADDGIPAPDASPADSAVAVSEAELPVWRQKLYYGYNFDIYFHHDTRSNRKENGWSISLEPEIGWRLKERVYLGLRVGGSYQDTYTSYSYEALDGSTVSQDIRVRQGSWNVTPYMRYRLKTLFDGKVGIWLEAHLYTGMEFPRVASGTATGSDYDGLRQSIIYGAQLSPVITYRFSRKRTFQIFFSILSVGYSGTTFCYTDPSTGVRHNEYTNDVIIFSGKLKNMLANQFTPGLYGLKFGIQKSF